jgi:hypothetical protein
MTTVSGMRMDRDGPLVLEPRSIYHKALLGWARRPGDACAVLIYDGPRMIEALVEEGMDELEACEWVSHNVESAWLGPGSPMVLNRIQQDEIEEALKEL